eukprot:scaffold5171_cov153-Ochromonas_danica.AAC.8
MPQIVGEGIRGDRTESAVNVAVALDRASLKGEPQAAAVLAGHKKGQPSGLRALLAFELVDAGEGDLQPGRERRNGHVQGFSLAVSGEEDESVVGHEEQAGQVSVGQQLHRSLQQADDRHFSLQQRQAIAGKVGVSVGQGRERSRLTQRLGRVARGSTPWRAQGSRRR